MDYRPATDALHIRLVTYVCDTCRNEVCALGTVNVFCHGKRMAREEGENDGG